jgi:hypothetical protein
MSVINTGDPYKDATILEAIEEEEKKKRPHCCICGEPIYDFLYDFLGAIYCEDCMNARYRHDADNYIEEDYGYDC